MKREVVLKGKICVIREYKLSDVSEIARLANNKKIAKNLLNGFSNPYKISDALSWIKSVIKYKKKNKFPLNMVITYDGKVAGAIGTGEIKSGKMTFGYWIGEEFWGKGIATDAVKTFIGYLFKTFKPFKIQANVYPWNKGSQRVLEKNGFNLDGVFKKDYLKDGKIIDQYYYSKLNPKKK